ncbi:hypothetical protein Tco_1399632 [Tanacetum coccineum]
MAQPLILKIDSIFSIHQLSYAALAMLTTRPACHPSLASCLSSHGESLLSVPDAYAVALSDVPGSGSRVHTHGHGGSGSHDG